MKRVYVFVSFLGLIAVFGYPFVQALQQVSDVKKSKTDFQKNVTDKTSESSPVIRSSPAWDDLPATIRDRLESLGFFPASLRKGSIRYSLKTLNGRRVDHLDHFGRWILINFWATWCPPCRMEMPSLDQLQGQFPDRLRVVTINVEQSPQTIRRFRKSYGFDLPVLLDSSGSTARRFGATGLPESWLITPRGKALAKLNGPLEWHTPPASTTFETLIETGWTK